MKLIANDGTKFKCHSEDFPADPNTLELPIQIKALATGSKIKNVTLLQQETD